MARLHVITSSMGLKLKPQKCRSLSIRAGKSEEIVFSLGDSGISSILHDKCHKFLGGFYTFSFSGPSVANIIRERISDQLENIDALLVRDEYKVKIYADYFLGANRFVFSVHDLCTSQLKALNDLTHGYLKKWLGLPQCASWALVHDAHGLNIKSISHLYIESRALNLANIRLFGDERVRQALDSKEEREGAWCQKFSSATFIKGLVGEVIPQVALDQDPVSEPGESLDVSLSGWSSGGPSAVPVRLSGGETGGLDVSLSSRSSEESAAAPVRPSSSLTRKQLKGKIQSGVQDWVDDFWKEKVGHYVMQGDYIALIMEEGNCITWKSYLWDVPQGVLKFAINAGINTLPTFDNLKRWGKRTSDRCPFCGNIQTLAHVLSNCAVFLDQGRFTWRHDSILMSIIDIVRPKLRAGFVLFSDRPGLQAPHGGTIPPHIIVTSFRPDLVLLDEAAR